MKLTTAILVVGMMSGAVWAQGPAVPQNAKDSATATQPKQNASGKTVVAVQKQPAAPAPKQAAKASASPMVKPAAAQAAKPGSSTPVVAVKAVAKPSATTSAKAPASPAVVKVAPPKVVAVSKPAASKPVAKPAVMVTKFAAKPTVKPVAKKAAPVKVKVAESKPAEKESSKENVSVEKAPEPTKTDKTKTISANGRRDPFVSPVISSSAVGSGCSVGKRCLAVDQISLKGVVKSETGMIAVVVNAMDKAYFLRENDPVFDGYVVKITGDSIVFKETVQDKLGKPFTREVTKKITTPVV
jgi:Tfp pilus assembly protein PilP